MEQNSLQELEKRLCTLNKEPESEENRLAMREIIEGIHGLIKDAKTVPEYSKYEDSLDTAMGLLRLKYRDFVPLDYVPLP